MTDPTPTARALTLLHAIRAGTATGRRIDDAWPQTDDLLLRSIHYWLWTQFDDESEALLRFDPRSPEARILDNCIRFLEADGIFHLARRDRWDELKHVVRNGVEWRDCELPWHPAWPFPPTP